MPEGKVTEIIDNKKKIVTESAMGGCYVESTDVNRGGLRIECGEGCAMKLNNQSWKVWDMIHFSIEDRRDPDRNYTTSSEIECNLFEKKIEDAEIRIDTEKSLRKMLDIPKCSSLSKAKKLALEIWDMIEFIYSGREIPEELNKPIEVLESIVMGWVDDYRNIPFLKKPQKKEQKEAEKNQSASNNAKVVNKALYGAYLDRNFYKTNTTGRKENEEVIRLLEDNIVNSKNRIPKRRSRRKKKTPCKWNHGRKCATISDLRGDGINISQVMGIQIEREAKSYEEFRKWFA